MMKLINFSRYLLQTAFLASIFILTACSGGSGQDVEQNPNTTNPDDVPDVIYRGPDANSEDVAKFKANLWDNLATSERCGACHVEGGTNPYFVRADDINLAYDAALPLVDLNVPSLSRIVEKVGGGHNCWEANTSVCVDVLTGWIERWAGEAGVVENTIVLTAPTIKPIGTSKSFPADSTDFQATVYPVLSQYCAGCHSENGESGQQKPYFASANVEIAYDAAKTKINLDDPAKSRFVEKLRLESHNCWDNSCVNSANTMQAAIQTLADGIQLSAVDPALVVSAALNLFTDGITVNKGGRFETNAIALYEFKPDPDNGDAPDVMAFDTSGIEPTLNLNLSGDTRILSSWGLRIGADGKAQGSTNGSKKLYDRIRATGEYSIEAWVVPGNVDQDGPARIATYSGGSQVRNFTLGQTMYNYNFMTRSSNSDANGMPMLSTPDAAEVLQATLQHVVTNFDPINGRRIYVNGELVAEDPAPGGNLNDWDDTYALVVGNEVDNQYLWQGTLRFLAIHNRVLTQEQILTNYDVGVGEKYYLLFSVSDLVDFPESFVVMEASRFDEYSYLLNTPFFISLSDQEPTGDIIIEGIHVGLNGKPIIGGQSFANLSVTINAENYEPGVGTPLSPLGAVFAQQKGYEEDEFFLSFDRIGNNTYSRVEPAVPAAAAPADLEQQSDIGLRLFGEINASIATATGVPASTASVANIFETVKQQLPTDESIDGFLAAHQAGVMQLSVAYCTELVRREAANVSYFAGFNFGNNYAQAFGPGSTGRGQIINPLLQGLVATTVTLNDGSTASLMTQPAAGALEAELNNLIDNMSGAATQTTVIATCAAAMGSAVMLLQ